MTAEITELSSTQKKINFKVKASEVDAAFKKAYRKIGGQAQIKGFRKGKVPAQVLDQYYKPQIMQEATQFILEAVYPKTLQENKIAPIGQPEFDVKPPEKNSDYQFGVTLEVKPQFELADYIGISLKKKESQIKDKDLKEELDRIAQSQANREPAPEGQKAENGLIVRIDFEGTIDGTPFKGGTAKDHYLELGAGQFLPDFEKNTVGMKKGEEKLFDLTFPKDYQAADLKGKTVQFRVKIHEVYLKKVPKIDDDFAKDLNFESLDKLKEDVKKSLLAREERQFRQDYMKEVVDYLDEKHQFEIPPKLFEAEKKAQAQRKPSDDDVKKSIRRQFVVDEIAAKEKIRAENQDLDRAIQGIAAQYRVPAETVREMYQKNNRIPALAMEIVFDKTLNFLIDKAKIA